MDDLLPVLGMVFALLMVLLIGGLILLAPLTRRLGELIELRMEERRGGAALPAGEAAELRRLVEGLQEQVAALADRQQFTEQLLERAGGESAALGPGTGASGAEPRPGQ